MNILHVINAYSPIFGCGPADRCQKMAAALTKLGHKVSIFTTDHSWDTQFAQNTPGVEILAFPFHGGRFCYSPSMAGVFSKRIREFDVVHLMNHWTYQNIVAYREVQRYGVPYVFSAMGALPIVYRSFVIKRIYMKLYGNRIIRDAKALVGITRMECDQYRAFPGTDRKIYYVPNAIDADEYKYLPKAGIFRNAYGISHEKQIILFLGRLDHIKGPDILLTGFYRENHRLPNTLLVFAGPDYGMENELKTLAKSARLEDRVIFCGPLTGKIKRAAYTEADVFVVPSRQENMSIVAVEACACGTPVVITESCDFNEIEEFGAGLVVSGDCKSIINGVIEILSNPNIKREMGNNAKKMVHKMFTWERVGKKMVEVLKEVVQKEH